MGRRVMIGRLAGMALLAGLMSTGAAAPAPAAQASQLPVGYWTLDETTGPAQDSAGTAPGAWNGTVNTVTTPLPPHSYNNQNGNTSRAISLAGALPDDYIEVANTPALENLQENSYTISAWVRPASIPPGMGAAWNAAYGVVLKMGLHEGIQYGNGQHFQFDHWKTGNVGVSAGTWAGAQLPPNAWYHVVAVLDRTAAEVRIFIDGNLRNTGTGVVEATREYAQTPWRIGIAYPGNAADYAWPMDGMIDDVRLYNYALTEPQIDILAAGVPAPQNLQAQDGILSTSLTWAPPTSPAGYTGGYTYNVYRSTTSGGPYTRIATGVAGTAYPDTINLPPGPSIRYYYVVTAVSVAESGFSGQADALASFPPPRTKDHQEGTFDDKCACGSTASGLPWLWALGGLAVLLVLRRSK